MDLGIGIDSDSEIVYSDDVENYTPSSSYIKIKDIIVYKNLKNVRVRWDFRNDYIGSPYDAYTKLYVNDEAVGVEHNTDSTDNITVYDVITDIEYGDAIQIYAKRLGGGNVWVLNMKLMYVEFLSNNYGV